MKATLNILRIYVQCHRLYESKKAEIEKERENLQDISDQYNELGNDTAKILENIVEIAGSIGNLWNRSIISEKREILTLLLSNCYMEGKRLRYAMLRPFSDLLKTPNCQIWSG